MKRKILIEHRVDGVLGYQLIDGTYVAILKAPLGILKDSTISWGDPYDWSPSSSGEHVWNCKNSIKWVKKESDHNFDYYIFNIKSKEGRFKYFFNVDSIKGKFIFNERGLFKPNDVSAVEKHKFGFTWSYSSIGKFVGTKDWWNKTAWYQIFPDRFASSKGKIEVDKNNYHSLAGGDLKGIISKLDYIKDLGFTGIYLNPIFKASSAHKYDTINYFDIDPAFGTMEDFEELVKQLKQRGMRIMLDGVFNHSGYEFPQWQDVLKNRNKSKYKDWFVIWDMDKIGTPKEIHEKGIWKGVEDKSFGTFANTPAMPRLNWANKEVSDFILDVIKFWIIKGIDAWRMDVADEVSFDMWRKVRITAKEINPEIQLLGEIWYDSQIFLNGDQFDSTMNYPFGNVAKEYFLFDKISEEDFTKEIIENNHRYSENINKGLFNLVGSHDTERILDVANGNTSRTNMLFAWLLLNQGSPSFYYGDEIDNRGLDKEFNREPFDWSFDKTNGTYNLIKSLLKFRNENIEEIISGPMVKNIANKIILEFSNGSIAEFNKNEKKLTIDGKVFKL